MSRQERRALDSKLATIGEEIRIPVTEHADARDGVLQFLAVAAYPYISEKPKRELFAEAMNAMLYKARAWTRGAGKYDSAYIRTLVPEEYRKLSNRSMQRLVDKGMKQINR